MTAKIKTEVSKFMSYALRHAPDEAGLSLDSEGWVAFADLEAAVFSRFDISPADLLDVIENNPKKRFTLEGSRIRAAQGHSVDIDLALSPVAPPARLFHGTLLENWASIQEQGLTKMSRNHVHLSVDEETANIVAVRRKGTHIILAVDAARMFSDGYSFFLSENGVWLTDNVPGLYISIVKGAAS